MSTTSVVTGFERLFDDAAIFPPGNAPMREAVQSHVGYRGNPLVGPFVCSAARLPELSSVLDELDATVDVSVVVPPGVVDLAPTHRMQVVAIEKQLATDEQSDIGPLLAARDQIRGAVDAYAEFPALPRDAQDVVAVAAAGLRLKFRTGGTTAAAFPTEPALAAALRAAVDAGVPFKCTAGLHNAVRHTGSEGFEHHGFLNVLLATAAAVAGAKPAEIVEVLAVRDGEVLARRFRGLSREQLDATRRAFVSFGTCSIGEPVADLRELGLLA